MINKILRVITIVLGLWLGVFSWIILRRNVTSAGIGWLIVLQLFSMITVFSIGEVYLNTRISKCIGLFLGFAFSYPAAYVIQYLVVLLKWIGKAILWVFKVLPFVGYSAVILLIVLVSYIIYKFFVE